MTKETTPKITTKKHLARLDRERRQRRIIQIVAIIVVILVVGVIVYGILDQTLLLNNKAVARVGNDKITVAEFDKQVRYSRWQMIRQYESSLQFYQMLSSDPNFGAQLLNNLRQAASQLDPQNASILASTVLDQMVNDLIVKQEAEKLGITVTDDEVEKALQEGFNYFPNGIPAPTITPTMAATSTLSPEQLKLIPPTAVPTTEPTLPADNTPAETPIPTATVDSSLPTATPLPSATPYTEEGYKAAVLDYVGQLKDTGFAETDIRKLIYTSLLRNKVYEALTADVPAEEEQVWARHILVKDKAQAQDIRKRLEDGGDWVKLAAEFSQDTSNKDKGGDLGWFGRGKMVPEFEEVAFKLEIGEISQPVETQFGYHIIQVIGHEIRPLTTAEIGTIKQTKFNEWLQTQNEKPEVIKYDLWKTVAPAEPTIPPELLQ